jgi:hypothetical protein
MSSKKENTIVEVSSVDDTKEPKEAMDNNEKKHRESIDHIFVSQYINGTDKKEYDAYVVTYSRENNSMLGWYVNIEENRQEQPKSDVYFRHDQLKNLNEISSFILCKKILVLFYRMKEEGYRNCRYLF